MEAMVSRRPAHREKGGKRPDKQQQKQGHTDRLSGGRYPEQADKRGHQQLAAKGSRQA